ncbi:MAG: nitroreductase [Lentisphaeria bacterium]|nr:nitroreductase [Lentisphaeria bacterium]
MTKANPVLEAMKLRRSIRKFRAEIPSEELIQKIMEAGSYAASGRGRQSAVIVEVKNAAVRKKLAEVNRMIGGWDAGFDPFYGAPVYLIVLAEKEWPTHVYDGSLVMGNLMLAAHAVGLGSCWIHRAKETFELPEWQEYLKQRGLTGEYEGIGFCALGYCEGDYPLVIPRKENRIFQES